MTDLERGHVVIGIEPIALGAMPVNRAGFGRLLLQLFDSWLLHNGRGCSWSIDDDHGQIEVDQNGISSHHSGFLLPAEYIKFSVL